MIPSPPDPSGLVPIIIPPSSPQQQQQSTTTSTTPIAFIFLPGAFLYPKDYSALVQELKNVFKVLSTDKNIPVWLIVAPIDWTKLNPVAPTEAEQLFNKAIENALTAAETAGFTKVSGFSGRYDNIFVGMHSMAVLAASGFAFHKAAGAVLLGASMVPTDTFWPSVHTYPRPILHIFGEMDGQAHVCRAALTAAEAAISAPSLGRKTAARECPIALIQGMNHAQFSNNIPNYARGDVDPYEKEQKVALEEVSEVIAAFLTAHAPSSSTNQENSTKLGAIDVLEDITMRAARYYTPYLRALGRPAAEDLLVCTEGACTLTGDLAHPLAYSHGAESLWFASPYCAFTAHPGELHVAELFAIKAQKALLRSAGLPSDVIAGIPVAAVAHTSKQTFVHSQPVILQCKDAPHGLIVKVHVLLQREAYPEGGLAAKLKGPIAASVSPTYALKLKSGEQIAYAITEMSRSLQNPEQFLVNITHHIEKPQPALHHSHSGSGCGSSSDGCRLSSEVYEEALVLVGGRAREIFKSRGFELIFKEDRLGGGGGEEEKVEAQHAHVSAWIDTPIILTKNDPQHQYSESFSSIESTISSVESKLTLNPKISKTVSIPSCHVAAIKEGLFDEGPSRFAGAVYFKAPSLAWCMEWILVAGLRNQ